MSTAERWVAMLVTASLAIVALVIFVNWPLIALVTDEQRVGKSFYVASESMWPTLRMNDRIMPRRVSGNAIRRGTVVVVTASDNPRIYRVVGLGGDRVAMQAGKVVLNGRPVPVAPVSTTLRAEQFPGERNMRRIADQERSFGDDMATVLIPPDRLFLLGGNRDRSADSRFGPEQMGMGLVDRRAVIGIVDTAFRRHGWLMRAVEITPAT